MTLKTLKSLAITSAVLAGVAGLGASALYAASPDAATQTTPMTSLVAKIAQTFHLNQADVQTVFDQQRVLMQQERGTKLVEKIKLHLDAAVKNGSLTQAQEELLIAKHTEIRTFMESLKGKTPTECRTAIEAKKTELKQWAKEHAIPEQYVRLPPHGRGGPEGRNRPERTNPENSANEQNGPVRQGRENGVSPRRHQGGSFRMGPGNQAPSEDQLGSFNGPGNDQQRPGGEQE